MKYESSMAFQSTRPYKPRHQPTQKPSHPAHFNPRGRISLDLSFLMSLALIRYFNPRGRISLDSKTIQNNQLNPSYIVFIIQPIKRVVIIILFYILIILYFFHFTGANLPEKICSLMIRTSIFKEVCIVSIAKKGSFNYGFNASPTQHRF